MKLTLFLVILLFSSCLKEEPIKLPYEGYTPGNSDPDWVISSPADENIVTEGLDKAYRLVYKRERYIMATSLLVVRNGKLVAEAYPRDKADAGKIQNIQSCTKSFTSLLAGIAISDGIIASVDEKLSDIYPDNFVHYPEKGNITLRHALTMKVGLDFDNGSESEPLYHCEGSSIDFVLSKDKLYDPGVVMHYNDGAPHLVSAAIQEKTGMTAEEYAMNNLFSPLGIEDVMWEKSADGITFGAFSLFLKPRDFAKVGQLLLQNGRWGDQQVIDSTWIALATSTLATGNFNGMPYGFYFWLLKEYNGYLMEGHGGQFLAVFPGKQLVIAYTAWPYTSGEYFDQYTELIDIIYHSCY